MNRRYILAALPALALGAALSSPAAAQTPAQIENLAKHFFGRAIDAKYGSQTDAKKLEKWSATSGAWAAERVQFIGYAAILADMFPDCLAPYIDTAPF